MNRIWKLILASSEHTILSTPLKPFYGENASITEIGLKKTCLPRPASLYILTLNNNESRSSVPIKPNDVILSKCAIVQRCIYRIREEYAADPSLSSFTHMDAMILNIERACKAVIDSAMHLVAQKKLGIPKNSGDAFSLLSNMEIIDQKLVAKLKEMTGYRNIAIHQYQEIERDILHHIAKEGWKDFIKF
jgi:uncharacterized protein YutE (UPF0331/DUF86 family)